MKRKMTSEEFGNNDFFSSEYSSSVDSTTSSQKRRDQIKQWTTMDKLEYNKNLLMRQVKPVTVDIKQLPDYMTYRRQKLKEK